MPINETVGDTIKVWSQEFKASKLKAIERLIWEIIDARRLDVHDKKAVLRHIGIYINRFDILLREKFTNIGTNNTRCARAEILLSSPQLNRLATKERFEAFIEKFIDTDTCRRQCRVDHVILEKFRDEVESYIMHASTLTSPSRTENRGFIKIAKNLEKILEEGGKACSCRMCGDIGDAVIALETPTEMRLEHTDHAFDHLCETINQPHFKHPPERSFIKS